MKTEGEGCICSISDSNSDSANKTVWQFNTLHNDFSSGLCSGFSSIFALMKFVESGTSWIVL